MGTALDISLSMNAEVVGKCTDIKKERNTLRDSRFNLSRFTKLTEANLLFLIVKTGHSTILIRSLSGCMYSLRSIKLGFPCVP